MKAFIFPGQGAQFVGMGKDFFDTNAAAKTLFEKADTILGFKITEIMFNEISFDILKSVKKR